MSSFIPSHDTNNTTSNSNVFPFNLRLNLINYCTVVLGCIAFSIAVLIAHWLSVVIYSKYCVPTNLFGFLTSIISAGSPLCQLVQTIQNKTMDYYMTIWGSVAVVACSTLFYTFNFCFNKLFSQLPSASNIQQLQYQQQQQIQQQLPALYHPYNMYSSTNPLLNQMQQVPLQNQGQLINNTNNTNTNLLPVSSNFNQLTNTTPPSASTTSTFMQPFQSSEAASILYGKPSTTSSTSNNSFSSFYTVPSTATTSCTTTKTEDIKKPFMTFGTTTNNNTNNTVLSSGSKTFVTSKGVTVTTLDESDDENSSSTAVDDIDRSFVSLLNRTINSSVTPSTSSNKSINLVDNRSSLQQ